MKALNDHQNDSTERVLKVAVVGTAGLMCCRPSKRLDRASTERSSWIDEEEQPEDHQNDSTERVLKGIKFMFLN